VLDFRKCIFPDRSLTPLFTLLLALLSSAHRLPSHSVWMIDVFLCALRPLLMDQVKVTESCLLMGVQLEKYSRSVEFIGSRYGVIAGIKNVAGPILRELVFAQLKKTDIRPGAANAIAKRRYERSFEVTDRWDRARSRFGRQHAPRTS
jgi:hypothetical protein